MAETRMDVTWHLILTPQEVRVVLRALRGNLRPEEVDTARELSSSITEQRMLKTRNLSTAMEHNFKMMKQAAIADDQGPLTVEETTDVVR